MLVTCIYFIFNDKTISFISYENIYPPTSTISTLANILFNFYTCFRYVKKTILQIQCRNAKEFFQKTTFGSMLI